ncbi:MAG: nucleoid-associated protein [Pseudohongiellaceae bacterium]|jgi:nucleoid-associated protein
MALLNFTAHRIHRLDPHNAATLHLRDSCWLSDGKIDECFRELKVSVIKRFTKDYGRFSSDLGNYPLSSWIKDFTEEKMGFESFSKKAMAHFKVEIDKTEILIDGFLLFAHEQLESDELIHLFFVQHNTAQFIDGNLDINESLYLETSRVNLAAKINISDWKSGDIHRCANLLTLLRWRGEKEITLAFANFIGFADKVDLGVETDVFLDTVSAYTQNLPEAEAFQTKKNVVDYCLEQNKIGKPVIITELATQLKEQPRMPVINEETGVSENVNADLPDFAAFSAEQKPAYKPTLIPDKTKLNQFVRLSGRDQKLSMSFSSSCLGDSIVYDPSTDSLTIHNIPSGLKARLAKHLKSN